MECNVIIASAFTAQKTSALFNVSLKNGDRESLLDTTIKRIKRWTGLDSVEDLTTSSYQFSNSKQVLRDNLSAWLNERSKDVSISTETLSNLESLWTDIIDESIENIQEFVRGKNKKILVNPKVNGENIIDPKNIENSLGNSTALLSLLEDRLNKGVTTATLFSIYKKDGRDYLPPFHRFVTSNSELNDNIIALKANWWADIVETVNRDPVANSLFIRKEGTSEWILNKKLFDKDKGESIYENILLTLKDKYNRLKQKSRIILSENQFSITEGFIKMNLLLNFDNFIQNKFGDLIAVNPDSAGTWGFPNNGESKYSLKQVGAVAKTFSEDKPGENDIEEYTTKLFKLISHTIPFKKANGEQVTNVLYLDTLQINAIGAVLGNIPNNVMFTSGTKSMNIPTWFESINNEESTFEEFLNALINDSLKTDWLHQTVDYIYSIKDYLYGRGAVVKHYEFEREKDINKAASLINIESLLYNQLRNSAVVSYRIEEIQTGKKSRVVNTLMLDSLITEDLESLYASLSQSWTNKPRQIENHALWKEGGGTLENFIDFIETFGEVNIGKNIISKIKKKRYGTEDTVVFPRATMSLIEQYFKKQVEYIHNEEELLKDEDQSFKRNLTQEEWVDIVRKGTFGNLLSITEIFKEKRSNEVTNLIANFKNADNNNMPTIAPVNLAYSFKAIAEEAGKRQTHATSKAILNSLGHFTVLLDVTTEKGNKSFNELSYRDNANIGILSLFFGSILNEEDIYIQPWNFADKSKVMVMPVNLQKLLTELNVENFKDFDSIFIKKQVVNINKEYFENLSRSIINDYNKLFPTVKSILDIKNVLSTMTVDELMKKVQMYNKENNLNPLTFVEELHYTKYNGKLSFNQILEKQIEVWTKDRSEEFFSELENNFLRDLEKVDLSVEGVRPNYSRGQIKNAHNIVYKLIDKFGFTLEDFDIVYNTQMVDVIEDGKKVFDENGRPVKKEVIYKDKNGNYEIKRASIKKEVDGKLTEPLKRFLWTRNLITHQLTNMSVKGSYLHPHKKGILLNNPTLEDLAIEEDERTVAFFKRMVIPGASIQKFKIGGHDGIKRKHLVAYVEDPTKGVFTPNGLKDKVKVHDGAIFVSPFFNNFLIDALPGANLSRVMKPIGISVDAYHSAMLKCATFGLNNELILSTTKSDFPLTKWMEKMHNIDFHKPILKNNLENKEDSLKSMLRVEELLTNLYVPYKGEYRKISAIGASEKGPHIYNVLYEGINEVVEVEAKNYYQLWKMFGGELSKSMVDGNLVFSEASINIVNKIVKIQALQGQSEFKDKLITMVIPRQAVKMGISNINPLSVFKKDEFNDKGELINGGELLTSIFDFSNYGMQLDASYSADESNVAEITQVLSSLSENNSTPEYYNEVYNTIEKVIRRDLDSFIELDKTTENGTKLPESKQLKYIANIFVKNLKRGTLINNAKAVLDNLESDLSTQIPFSDRALFKQFVSTVITNINKEFIRKRIRGAGLILNPSQGMLQVFESKNGKIYLYSDLINMFDNLKKDKPLLNTENLTESQIAEAKVNYILNKESGEFSPTDLKSIFEVAPLDIIRVIENNNIIGEYNLYEINDYYSFIDIFKNSEGLVFQKIHNKPRDLKPSEKKFSYIVKDVNRATNLLLNSPEKKLKAPLINWNVYEDIKSFLAPIFQNAVGWTDFKEFVNHYIASNIEYRNGYNIEVTKQKFKFSDTANLHKNYTDKLGAVLTLDYINKFNNYLLRYNKVYSEKYNRGNHEVKFKLLEKYLDKLVKRVWSSIGENKMIIDYSPNMINYFEEALKLSNGTFDILNDNISLNNYYVRYEDLATYKTSNFEKIESKLYKSEFNLGEARLANINQDFFRKMYNDFGNRKHFKHYDLLLGNTFDQEKSLQVIFIEDLKTKDQFLKDIGSDPNIWRQGIYLLDEEKQLVKTKKEFGVYDIIGEFNEIETNKTSSLEEIGVNQKEYRLNSRGEKMYTIEDSFKYDALKGKVAMFRSNGLDIVLSKSRQLGEFVQQNNNYFDTLDVWDNNPKQKELYNSLIEDTYDSELRQYLTKRRKILETIDFSKTITKEVIDDIRKTRINYLDKKSEFILNSWKLSRHGVVSRIPAQAGQSYKASTTVAYLHDNENSIYVSHWQIFLDGADFDIDKAYQMSYSFKNGLFIGWSPYFSLSSRDIGESFKLPIPNGQSYSLNNEDTIITEKDNIIDIDLLFNDNNKFTRTTSNIVKLLNYVNSNTIKDKKNIIKTDKKEIFNIIKTHNKYFNEEALNNYKVYNILETSRSPKHYISSHSPATFGDYRTLKRNKDSTLNISNPISIYIQQENNYIGKGVIGIAATGIKTYFALIAYYSNKLKNGMYVAEDPAFFNRKYTINGITRIVQRPAGLNLDEAGKNIFKNILANSWQENKYEKEDGSFYTIEELLSFVDDLEGVEDPSIKLSSLLSAATDNAKELILADINAGTDFAGVHIFLILMGFNEIEVAKYMTSDLVNQIKELTSDSFLYPRESKGLDSRILDLSYKSISNRNTPIKLEKVQEALQDKDIAEVFSTKEGKRKIKLDTIVLNSASYDDFMDNISKRLDNLLTTYQKPSKETLEKVKKNIKTAYDKLGELFKEVPFEFMDTDRIQRELEEFQKILLHSKELISVGSQLSVNQGVKATLEDTYKFSKKISNILSNQLSSFINLNKEGNSFSLKALDDLLVAYKSLGIWDSLSLNKKEDILKIINNKFKTQLDISSNINRVELQNQINNYIADKLVNIVKKDKPYLSDIYIKDTLNNVFKDKLITEGLNYNNYFKDKDYRKNVIDYYNLIKFNINVLDVLENSSHFKAMTESFQKGNLFLETNVLGYRAMTQFIPKLVDIGILNGEITPYSYIKKVKNRGRKSGQVDLAPEIHDKVHDVLLNNIIVDWLDKEKFLFDFTAYILDIKENGEELNLKMIKNTKATIDDTIVVPKDNPGDNFVTDLTTEYGIAKFKYIMDQYIIPYWKKQNTSNEFLNHYRYRHNFGYNMRRTIKFYDNPSNSVLTLAIERGIERIYNNQNNKYSIPVRKETIDSTIRSIEMMDLLNLYNIFVNTGRAGGNRATKFLTTMPGKPGSILRSFVNFQSEKERDPEYIKKLIDNIAENVEDSEEIKEAKKNYREVTYLTLFGNNYKGSKTYIQKEVREENGKLEQVPRGIHNHYFMFPKSIDTFMSIQDQQDSARKLKALAREAARKVENTSPAILSITNECN